MSKTIVGGIIGLITFVFVFFGVFNPKATRGLHEGSVAGTVNGEPISLSEFNREYSRRLEFFKNFGGAGKLSEAQLKAFRIKEGVFTELVNRKLMEQAAEKNGLVASDEELRDRIKEIPAFQKNGKFDSATYRQVLTANNYSPGTFERMMREDLSVQQWAQYFRNRVHVSDEELKKEYLANQDKRNLKYVVLTLDAGRRAVQVNPAEIDKFFKDPARANLAKAQFDARKDTEFKGKTFDQVKSQIAHDILASEKTDEIQKANDKLADQILPLLTAEKGSDAKVNALLKPYNAEVKTTSLSRSNHYIPGAGDSPELVKDAFAKNSPINTAQGGKAKKYSRPGYMVVALVSGVENPDLAKFDQQKPLLKEQMLTKKERELYGEWLKKLTADAKIERNDAVVGEESEG